jgi:hypothetical protein
MYIWCVFFFIIFFENGTFVFITTIYADMKKEGIKSYYQTKIEECELVMNQKSQDLRRLEAQRNALNAKGKNNSNNFARLLKLNHVL